MIQNDYHSFTGIHAIKNPRELSVPGTLKKILVHLKRKKSLSFQEKTQIAMECLLIAIAVGSACISIPYTIIFVVEDAEALRLIEDFCDTRLESRQFYKLNTFL